MCLCSEWLEAFYFATQRLILISVYYIAGMFVCRMVCGHISTKHMCVMQTHGGLCQVGWQHSGV